MRSRAAHDHIAADRAPDAPGKRGRKATPPNPEDGPLAAFAHDLWVLKRRAGDPSFATMCTQLGAAASKSSLAAATRGTALPSWETTWEFVRVLAVDQLGTDAEDTRAEWLARWTAVASATGAPATDTTATADPAAADSAATDPTAADTEESAGTGPAPDRPADASGRHRPLFRPTRGQAVMAGVLAVLIGVLLGSLVLAYPAVVSGPTGDAGSDNASFEGDVTFPDGSVVAPGQQFTKVWQLRNIGSTRWEGRYLTRVNSTACQAPDMAPIPITEPGQSVRIAVPVTAAQSPGQCKIFWKMTDADRTLLLPDKNPIYLDVVVQEPA